MVNSDLEKCSQWIIYYFIKKYSNDGIWVIYSFNNKQKVNARDSRSLYMITNDSSPETNVTEFCSHMTYI